MKERRGEREKEEGREEERKKERVGDMINHQLYFEEPMSVPVILFSGAGSLAIVQSALSCLKTKRFHKNLSQGEQSRQNIHVSL